MATQPRVKRIKKEKRDQPVEPAPAGMSRRRFLTFLGTGSAAMAAGSAGMLTGCAQSEERGSKDQGSQTGESARTGGAAGGRSASFKPIEPSDADELVLPEGFRYEII